MPTCTLTLENTIVALNMAGSTGPNVSGLFVSQGNNLIGDGTGSTGFTDGVKVTSLEPMDDPVKPLLGPLQDNGGPTQTMALLVGSRAIDAGNNTAAPTTDQRGVIRILPGTIGGLAIIDIGAFEYDPAPTPIPVISDVTVAEADVSQDGTFLSTESLKITWTVTTGLALTSQR